MSGCEMGGPSSDGTNAAPQRELVWRDDFDGPAGSAVDPTSWTHETGGGGWGNRELQRYRSGTSNAALDGAGHLVITARRHDASDPCWYGTCRYTSARLTTEGKVSFTGGRVEARIKLPTGKGIWPAFWLLGENRATVGWPRCGEVDVMELVGHEGNRVWSSVHGPGYVRAGLTAGYTLPGSRSFADDFHVFAVEWTQSEALEFSVDGTPYHRVARQDISAGNEWVFDKPMHVLLNVAVGGEWPGSPTADTRFPAQMIVDQVSIYR